MLSFPFETLPLVALAMTSALALASAAYTPIRYPIKTLDLPIIDAKTACDNLKSTIPAMLRDERSTHYTEPMEVEYPIAMLYADGANPTTKELYAGIPEPVLKPARESLSSIIQSVGDWTRSQIISDLGYGLEDQTQTSLGGLPAFCRFGASIVTSNSSATWFETWLPLPTDSVSQSSSSDSAMSTSSTKSTSSSDTSMSTSKPKSASGGVSSDTTSRHPMSRRAQKSQHHASVSTRKSTGASQSMGNVEHTGTASNAYGSTKHSQTPLSSGHGSSHKSYKGSSSSGMSGSMDPSSSFASSSSSSSPGASPTSTASVIDGRASPDNWQGRMIYLGSGGQRGSVSYPDMKQVLTRYRQAAASSNLGHFGTGAGTTWTIGNVQAQIDFAYRGTHAANLAAQVVVSQFYGVEGPNSMHRRGANTESKRKERLSKRYRKTRKLANGRVPHFGFPAYYAGCSTGGRQGMAEAYRYPYDFNGILAGSPAVYYNELNAYQIHVNSYQNDTSSPKYIPENLYPLIHQVILDQCDLNDGIKDAVIEDPFSCEPDLNILLCPPSSSSGGSTSKSSSSAMSFSSASDSLLSSAATSMPMSTQDASSNSMTSSAEPSSAPPLTSNNASFSSFSTSIAPASNSATQLSSAKMSRRDSASHTSSTSLPESTYLSGFSSDSGRCLTQSQLDNLKNIYKTYRYPSGELIHEPVEYGSETVWTVTDGVVGKPFPPAPGWYQYQVLNRTDPTDDFDYYNEVTFDLIREAQRINPAGTNTGETDFNKFFSHGGKLMHYHGFADQLIPAGSSLRFRRNILKDYDENAVGGPSSDFYRFFPIPGMGHCRGGDGAWNFGGASQSVTGARPYRYDAVHDMMLALWRWTEDGHAPTHIDGASYNVAQVGPTEPKDYITTPDQSQGFANGLKYTHRLCPYPKQAVLTDPRFPYRAQSQRCERK